jgi:thioesterase domain-containing protein
MLRAGGERPPLFCLPHVFGDSLAYRRLLDYLPDDQPLYAVEPPEPSAEFDGVRHEDLTAAYLEAIHTWQPDGRYVLTGHSMGATTAFEMALQLSERGGAPAQLILIEPSIEFGLSTARGDLGRRFVELLAEVAERPAPEFDPRLDSESDAEFFAGLLAVMTAGGLAESGLDTTSLAYRFRGFAANMRALRGYRPRREYPGRIVLVRSATESITTLAEWRERCAGVDEVIVPGDHFSIWNEPNVAAVARSIGEHLAATPRATSEGENA